MHYHFSTLVKLCTLALLLALVACDDGTEPKQTDSSNSTNKDAADKADLLITNATTIDAVNGLKSAQTIIINDDRITQILESVPDSPTEHALVVVDGTGKYLIPGLWDAHVHTTFDPSVSDSMHRLFVGTGITSIRDTGGQLDLVTAWRDAAIKSGGPTTYIAGPLIDGVPTVYSGEQPGYPKIAVSTQSPEQVIKAVDDLVAAGVNLLKAYEMLSPESFRALITQAHKHGLPVTGHVPLSMSAIDVANSGLDSMEHLRNLEMDCSVKEPELFTARQKMLAEGAEQPGSKLRIEIHKAQHFEAVRTYDAERCKKLIAVLAEQDVWQIPTLTLMLSSVDPYFVQDDWRKTFDYLPTEVREQWLDKTNSYKEATLAPPDQAKQERIKVADWKESMIKEFLDAGIPVMAGTDTPILFLTPGFSLHKELQTLVSAGMSPMQALESATLAPARYFSLEDQQGTIAAGMLADLVLLNANPLDDISNTLEIESVIHGGYLHNRSALDALLEPSTKRLTSAPFE